MNTIQAQFKLHQQLGFMWSGWMGGQWAMTAEILSYIEGRELIVPCGGPGDLAFNALKTRCTSRAVNVDISMLATDYGRHIRDSASLGDSNRLIEIRNLVQQINVEESGVPVPLRYAHLLQGLDRRVDNLQFVCSDALAYFRHDLQPTDAPTFIYLATPTVLPDGVLSKGRKHFFELYDPEVKSRLEFDWAEPASELNYLDALICEIRRKIKNARIGFGVGEGDTPLADYLDFFQAEGKAHIAMEKGFQGDGYSFTDWLIICDLSE